MAKILKERARKPLAKSMISWSWGQTFALSQEPIEVFTARIRGVEETPSGDTRSFSMVMGRKEAEGAVYALVGYLIGHGTEAQKSDLLNNIQVTAEKALERKRRGY